MTKKHFDLAIIAFLAASSAMAHPGHGVDGFTTGLLHPLYGVDHLITALAIGVWAACVGGRALFALPTCFVISMIVGAYAGFEGHAFVFAESGILLSMALLGLALLFFIRMPLLIAMPILSAFGIFHGNAHGTEMGLGLSAASYALGFTISTASLHFLGILGIALLKNSLNETNAQALVRIFGTLTLVSLVFLRFGIL